ncbi:ATP-binding protein, partial [Actinomadura miaoliensis]|uniref:ATP-binding protein n=1 Tax=Actinomadura miaoliensis TaxID=430685 RepID=UPI0031E55525
MIDRLLADVRLGRSGALVLRGEAGIGKSALLDYAAAAAGDGVRVLRGAGVEPEMELPFAGLHLLLRPALEGIGRLPAPQAEALRGALGLVPAPGKDLFLVGLAVLTLLADLAERCPLVCLVDDAHWLDHASAEALLFAARRLEAEGVALVFAARDDDRPFPAPGVAELRLDGLDAAAAAELLAERAADLPPRVRDRILEDALGNPLALLELPATLSPAQRRGELPVRAVGLGEVTASSRLRQTFCDRVAALPGGTGALLLVAAADDTGRLDVVLEAAGRLGASLADIAPAETARLVRVTDGRLVFRHPLIRAAVYQNAPVTLRLATHRALAESLDGHADDADRRAWHLASAATGPDEDTAAALERCAEHARTRGGYAAVAAAYERAAQLTPARLDRGRRLVAAATAALDAGWWRRATELAEAAIPDLEDPPALARAAQVRAAVATAEGRPRAAHALLTEAAGMLTGRDDDTAAAMYSEATTAAWLAA